jgi:DNA-binding MarR family transcriptional regulator
MMSIMVDELENEPTATNLRTLIYHLGLVFDERLTNLRRGTIYEHARNSDGRLFVTAARAPHSISEIARELRITRQAAQMSVQRLLKLGVVELRNAPGNSRDKHVVLTPRGKQARKTAARQINHVEQQFANLIGAAELENLRGTLARLIEKLREAPDPGLIDPALHEL